MLILFVFWTNQLLDSLIFCIVFFRLYFIYFCFDLYYFLRYTHGALWFVPFQVHFGVKLDCLFELFLAFWDKPLMLWISSWGLLSWCSTDFGLLCPHFHLFHPHLFQGIFWFLNLTCWPIHCNNMLFSFHVFLCFSVLFLRLISNFLALVRGDAW